MSYIFCGCETLISIKYSQINNESNQIFYSISDDSEINTVIHDDMCYPLSNFLSKMEIIIAI